VWTLTVSIVVVVASPRSDTVFLRE